MAAVFGMTGLALRVCPTLLAFQYGISVFEFRFSVLPYCERCGHEGEKENQGRHQGKSFS